MLRKYGLYLTLAFMLFAGGCASQFPSPENAPYVKENEALDGPQLFSKTFDAHGGQFIDELNDLNVSITGEWKTLIKRIQPLVTDYTYRVDSEERILPNESTYASLYTGPAGNKKVVRTPNSIEVFYNGEQSSDTEVLSSTALTADSFLLFLLGPLAVSQWSDQFTRLADVKADGETYHRIYVKRRPGFGLSDEDELALWIDPVTFRTKRVQITLEGHSTTQGAHVEVEFLDYKKLDKFLFPVDFFEVVNAPIAIDAHAWQIIGLDINRGLSLEDLQGAGYSEAASRPATPLR
jgi:hypothetical protein